MRSIRLVGLLLLWAALALSAAAPAARAQTFIPVDPTTTYLHTNQDPAGNSPPILLSSLVFNGHALHPGDTINLAETGDFLPYGSSPTFATAMIGVFSSSSVLLDSSVLRRVPGAIGEGDSYMTSPSYYGNQPTDIPEDFFVNPGTGTTVTIPPGARYLFLSTGDTFFSDNSNPHNNFGANLSFVSSGVTYYVSTLGSDSNSGLDPTHPKRDIQNAINASAAGDQILVAAGTYYEHVFLTAGRQMFGGYSSDFTSRSSDPDQTILDGGGTGNVITHGNVVTTPHRLVDGFTIQHGYCGLYLFGTDMTISHNHITANIGGNGISVGTASPQVTVQIHDNLIDNNVASGLGGGIWSIYSTLSITNNVITGNVSKAIGAQGGGGITLGGCTSTISNNTISDNTSRSAGGGIFFTGGMTTVSGNTISGNVITGNNSSDNGGGLEIGNCNGTLANNLITENTAPGYGGGVHAYGSPLSILNNKIIANNAGINSGGIEWDNSPGTIANNLVVGNQAADYGGGISTGQGKAPAIVNNTIVGNQAAISIGGINVYLSSPLIANNIVAFNENGGINGSTSSVLSHNCVYGNTVFSYGSLTPGPGDISLGPLFVNAAAGDYHLSDISPCLDAGDDSAVDPAWTDLDGLPRIHNGTVDIGAYEFQGVSADVTGQVQVTRGPLVYSPKTQTYTQTLTLKNIGATTLAGPLQAVLTGLGSSVTLLNATGTYAGREPYLTATADALAPGAAVSLKAVFHDPTDARFTYQIKVYSASF